MHLSEGTLSRLRETVVNLYSKPFNEALILDTADAACRLLGFHYFSVYPVSGGNKDTSMSCPTILPISYPSIFSGSGRFLEGRGSGDGRRMRAQADAGLQYPGAPGSHIGRTARQADIGRHVSYNPLSDASLTAAPGYLPAWYGKPDYLDVCGNTDIEFISYLEGMYVAGSFKNEDRREVCVDSLGLDINDGSPATDVIYVLLTANVEVFYEPQ